MVLCAEETAGKIQYVDECKIDSMQCKKTRVTGSISLVYAMGTRQKIYSACNGQNTVAKIGAGNDGS